MYSSQKWFDAFYNKFTGVCSEDEKFGMDIRSQKWTRVMMNFLEDLGKEQGFTVDPERLTIDQFWKHPNKGTVAVEHEISAGGILKKELPNLVDISSDLKVLITYVYDYQFPWEPYEISERIKKEIDSKYVKRFKEFLLVIGTKTQRDKRDRRIFMERSSDWFALTFYIGAVKTKILLPSPSRRARQAWKTRKEE